MPLHLPVLARSLRALLLHRPLPRAPRQSPTPYRMRCPHPASPRRRSPPLFRRSRKNPPHRQRRQHPPLEPLPPPPRTPSRIPRPAPWPNHLRILRHPTNPTPPPRPNPLTSGTGFSLCSSLPFVGAELAPPRLGFSRLCKARPPRQTCRFIALWHSHPWLCAFPFLHRWQSFPQHSANHPHRLNPNPHPRSIFQNIRPIAPINIQNHMRQHAPNHPVLNKVPHKLPRRWRPHFRRHIHLNPAPLQTRHPAQQRTKQNRPYQYRCNNRPVFPRPHKNAPDYFCPSTY